MKKYIIIGSIVLVFVVAGVYYFVYLRHPYNTNLSKLSTVTVDGQDYKTTGAIPVEDTKSADLLTQVIKLSDLGTISTTNFKMLVDNDGKVQITLYPPYDESKQAAIKWIKDKGFDLITEDRMVFTNSTNPQ